MLIQPCELKLNKQMFNKIENKLEAIYKKCWCLYSQQLDLVGEIH